MSRKAHGAVLASMITTSILASGACSSSQSTDQSSAEVAALTTVRNAIAGEVDDKTASRMAYLIQNLPDGQRFYLENMDWTDADTTSVPNDKALANAFMFIQLGYPSTKTSSITPASVRVQDTVTSPASGLTGDFLVDVKKVMRECWGEAKCYGMGCVTAVIDAYIDLYGPIGGQAPNPVPVDHGTWSCALDFDAPADAGVECSFQGFCRDVRFTKIGTNKSKPSCGDSAPYPGKAAKCSVIGAPSADAGTATPDSSAADSSKSCWMGDVQWSGTIWCYACTNPCQGNTLYATMKPCEAATPTTTLQQREAVFSACCTKAGGKVSSSDPGGSGFACTP